MQCLNPDGGMFIRAVEGDESRSLTEAESVDFLIAMKAMPWCKGN
jgi:hypothetical protein